MKTIADVKKTGMSLRYGGKKACENCPIKKLDGYTCPYPESDKGATCIIITDALDALEATE